MEELSTIYKVSILGFFLGIGFGAVAQKTHFCTMGAISDIYFFGDWNRFRSWVLAISAAIIGSQALHLTGIIDLTESIYLSAHLGWGGAVIGGLIFGFGMTLGGGCGNKTLVRLGAGNLKSLLVALFIGLFSYMTLRGLIGLFRLELEGVTTLDLSLWELESQGIQGFLLAAGANLVIANVLPIIIIAGGGLLFCFKCKRFRNSSTDIIAGIFVGSCVPIGWYITGVIGSDEFDPTVLSSLSFIAPVGESLQFLLTFTGSSINFGIAVVGGIILGSFIAAKLSGEFQVEAFTGASDMINHIIGGSLMGVGGVLALGCTIGQGVTGMSTLAFGSVIALVSIWGGGIFGMKYLEEGTIKNAAKSFFNKG